MNAITIRKSAPADAPALTSLVNRAFKPAESFFLENDRVTLEQLQQHLTKGFFLIAEDNEMAACVYVEIRGGRGYFGMLSVDPARQGAGLARVLITAAEDHCREAGCAHMDITVVNLRTELPPFYRKLGYSEDGTMAFPPEVPVKLPLHLIKMTKPLQSGQPNGI